MARKKLEPTPIIAIKKPKEFSSSGYQYRVPWAKATAEKLLYYRNCIAKELRGKVFEDYRAVRRAFTEIAKKCSAEAKAKYGPTPKRVAKYKAKLLAGAI